MVILESYSSFANTLLNNPNNTSVDTLHDHSEILLKSCRIFDVAYLKLVSAIFYQIFIFSPNDSPSKTVKNVFYFI